MKRSRINRAIKRMEELAREHGFKMPPFCSFTPEEWANKNSEGRRGFKVYTPTRLAACVEAP